MFTANPSSVRTMATSFAAAALFTTLAVAGAASRAEAATDTRFVTNVERQIAATPFVASTNTGTAIVAVQIDSSGQLVSADVAKSSGHADLDREAVATARSIAYPAGTAKRTVAVVLSYGTAVTPSKADSASLVSHYVDAHGRALATQTPTFNAG